MSSPWNSLWRGVSALNGSCCDDGFLMQGVGPAPPHRAPFLTSSLCWPCSFLGSIPQTMPVCTHSTCASGRFTGRGLWQPRNWQAAKSSAHPLTFPCDSDESI